MPKTAFTPRDQLVCGKLDALWEAVHSGDKLRSCELISAIQRDCERMESKLVLRKAEVERLSLELAKERQKP